MTDPKETSKPKVQIREPKKKTQGIFDNLRKIDTHPVEEILGLVPHAEIERTPPTPPTPRTARTPPVAPERDYMKVANSITREMVSGGHFSGKSKQLYDFLYSKTRGAVVPARSIRITKPKLMLGAGIGSERTLLKNIAHLKSIGLLKVSITDGKHGGNEYIVLLPEEVESPEQPTPRTPPTPPTPRHAQHGRHALQKVGGVRGVESGVGGVGSETIESTTSGEDKTFSLRPQKTIDDDDAALAGFTSILKRAAKDVTGKEPSVSEAERWRELGELLSTELKIAAARTAVSSVPSFFAEHLRRRLFKKDQKQMAEEASSPSSSKPGAQPLTDEQIRACRDCGGSGLYYPEGYEKGVTRCRHEKLSGEGS